MYFPDWAGNLYAVDKWTGQQKWSTTIASATGIPGDKARATPAIAGNKLIIGTQGPFGGGGKVLAFNKKTGALIWSTTLDDHPAAIITQSATVNGKVVYVGTSSLEESFAALIPGYPCCSFRGKMAALDLDTGAILWQTVMTPEGFPGNAVWGSSPAVDAKRGQLYIATGNNYDAPQDTLDCIADAGERSGGAAGVPSSRQLLRLGARTRLENRRDSLGDTHDRLRRLDSGLHPIHRRGDQLSRTGGA